MSVNPVTGQDSDTHAASTAQGMIAAREVRDKYLAGIIDGSLKLEHVIEFSRGKDSVDAKYLSKLRLSRILAAKPGWDASAAREALERNGFKVTDTLTSVRASRAKITLFTQLFDAPGERWKQRPEVPKGWPWMGKLSVLVREAGEPIPEELLQRAGVVSDDADPVSDDDLNDLFGGPTTPGEPQPVDDDLLDSLLD